ncbi:MAG: hypothetical protein SGJ24_07305 [Chloroflexota bacterium]|nr:hypothetical protein [Chloroflexota bacterium]
MSIETTRIAPGILFAMSIGQSSFAELGESRAIGMKLLQEAGDKEWVLIMDMTEARTPGGRSSTTGEMNVDSLRGVTQKNNEIHLLGYIVLGANPAIKLLMRTYGIVFRVNMYFETTQKGALVIAQKLIDKHHQRVP